MDCQQPTTTGNEIKQEGKEEKKEEVPKLSPKACTTFNEDVVRLTGEDGKESFAVVTVSPSFSFERGLKRESRSDLLHFYSILDSVVGQMNRYEFPLSFEHTSQNLMLRKSEYP